MKRPLAHGLCSRQSARQQTGQRGTFSRRKRCAVHCVQAGELREYVLQEANVCEVEICNDPLEYASVRAEPNYQVCFLHMYHNALLDASGVRRSLHVLCECSSA